MENLPRIQTQAKGKQMSEENIKVKILLKHIEHLIDYNTSISIRLDDLEKTKGSHIVPFVMVTKALIEIRNAITDIFELGDDA